MNSSKNKHLAAGLALRNAHEIIKWAIVKPNQTKLCSFQHEILMLRIWHFADFFIYVSFELFIFRYIFQPIGRAHKKTNPIFLLISKWILWAVSHGVEFYHIKFFYTRTKKANKHIFSAYFVLNKHDLLAKRRNKPQRLKRIHSSIRFHCENLTISWRNHWLIPRLLLPQRGHFLEPNTHTERQLQDEHSVFFLSLTCGVRIVIVEKNSLS